MARLSDSITYGNHAITGDVDVGGTLTIGGVVYQQVNLTGGTNVTVSGSYPNFTISSTDTNTTYSAGTGINLVGTSFSLGMNSSYSGEYPITVNVGGRLYAHPSITFNGGAGTLTAPNFSGNGSGLTGTSPTLRAQGTLKADVGLGNVSNVASSISSTGSTNAQRDSSGDIQARLFRSEYDTTNSSANFIMTQVDTTSNNYLRPSTPTQVKNSMGIGNNAERDVFIQTTEPTSGQGVDGDVCYVYTV